MNNDIFKNQKNAVVVNLINSQFNPSAHSPEKQQMIGRSVVAPVFAAVPDVGAFTGTAQHKL